MNGQTRKINQRLIALLLCLVMVLTMGILPGDVDAAETSTTVIAGSDFQARNGNAAGATIVNGVIDQIKADGYTKLDGFLFAGDYSVGATKEADVTYLKDTIHAAYPELTDNTMVLIQGNHDNASEYGGAEAGLVGNVIDVSGAHDAENYGVYVINEQDYMWRNSDETTIQNTANALDAYLDTKVAEGYGKPIFVVSHLPLHYSMRTRNDGDGMYANYIFDVLNDAGAKGLNIIFLYGHDHSNGWDDYLGGSCVYLAKGKNINIAQGSKTEFNVETLNFTYM
ncbi:MAG: metallophosphoesterase, partial [Clostridiales bacterium]|nr:metallophosphoesterase [Clostridiales bacterium]